MTTVAPPPLPPLTEQSPRIRRETLPRRPSAPADENHSPQVDLLPLASPSVEAPIPFVTQPHSPLSPHTERRNSRRRSPGHERSASFTQPSLESTTADVRSPLVQPAITASSSGTVESTTSHPSASVSPRLRSQRRTSNNSNMDGSDHSMRRASFADDNPNFEQTTSSTQSGQFAQSFKGGGLSGGDGGGEARVSSFSIRRGNASTHRSSSSGRGSQHESANDALPPTVGSGAFEQSDAEFSPNSVATATTTHSRGELARGVLSVQHPYQTHSSFYRTFRSAPSVEVTVFCPVPATVISYHGAPPAQQGSVKQRISPERRQSEIHEEEEDARRTNVPLPHAEEELPLQLEHGRFLPTGQSEQHRPSTINTCAGDGEDDSEHDEVPILMTREGTTVYKLSSVPQPPLVVTPQKPQTNPPPLGSSAAALRSQQLMHVASPARGAVAHLMTSDQHPNRSQLSLLASVGFSPNNDDRQLSPPNRQLAGGASSTSSFHLQAADHITASTSSEFSHHHHQHHQHVHNHHASATSQQGSSRVGALLFPRNTEGGSPVPPHDDVSSMAHLAAAADGDDDPLPVGAMLQIARKHAHQQGPQQSQQPRTSTTAVHPSSTSSAIVQSSALAESSLRDGAYHAAVPSVLPPAIALTSTNSAAVAYVSTISRSSSFTSNQGGGGGGGANAGGGGNSSLTSHPYRQQFVSQWASVGPAAAGGGGGPSAYPSPRFQNDISGFGSGAQVAADASSSAADSRSWRGGAPSPSHVAVSPCPDDLPMDSQFFYEDDLFIGLDDEVGAGRTRRSSSLGSVGSQTSLDVNEDGAQLLKHLPLPRTQQEEEDVQLLLAEDEAELAQQRRLVREALGHTTQQLYYTPQHGALGAHTVSLNGAGEFGTGHYTESQQELLRNGGLDRGSSAMFALHSQQPQPQHLVSSGLKEQLTAAPVLTVEPGSFSEASSGSFVAALEAKRVTHAAPNRAGAVPSRSPAAVPPVSTVITSASSFAHAQEQDPAKLPLRHVDLSSFGVADATSVPCSPAGEQLNLLIKPPTPGPGSAQAVGINLTGGSVAAPGAAPGSNLLAPNNDGRFVFSAPPTSPSFHHVVNLQKHVDDDGNKTINQYVVIADLGRGATGKVKLAVDRDDDTKLVAIKIVRRPKTRAGMSHAHPLGSGGNVGVKRHRLMGLAGSQASMMSAARGEVGGGGGGGVGAEEPRGLHAGSGLPSVPSMRTGAESPYRLQLGRLHSRVQTRQGGPQQQRPGRVSPTPASTFSNKEPGLLPVSASQQQQEIDQFVLREITIMRRLRHRNLVRLRAVIDDPSSEKLYLLLDYVPHGTLLKKPTEKDFSLASTSASISDSSLDESPLQCSRPHPFGKRLYGHVAESIARVYMAQLLQALQYLHRNAICHRDIKPDNILRGDCMRIFLTDFGESERMLSLDAVKEQIAAGGWSRHLGGSSSSAASAAVTSSSSSTFRFVRGAKGTPSFWAPELFSTDDSEHSPSSPSTASPSPHSPRIMEKKSQQLGSIDISIAGSGWYIGEALDLWAAAVTCYMMVTGHAPFPGDRLLDIRHSVLRNEPLRFPTTCTVSKDCQDFLSVLLHKDPTKRMCDVEAALEHPFLSTPDSVAPSPGYKGLVAMRSRRAMARTGSSVLGGLPEIHIGPSTATCANSATSSSAAGVAPERSLLDGKLQPLVQLAPKVPSPMTDGVRPLVQMQVQQELERQPASLPQAPVPAPASAAPAREEEISLAELLRPIIQRQNATHATTTTTTTTTVAAAAGSGFPVPPLGTAYVFPSSPNHGNAALPSAPSQARLFQPAPRQYQIGGAAATTAPFPSSSPMPMMPPPPPPHTAVAIEHRGSSSVHLSSEANSSDSVHSSLVAQGVPSSCSS